MIESGVALRLPPHSMQARSVAECAHEARRRSFVAASRTSAAFPDATISRKSWPSRAQALFPPFFIFVVNLIVNFVVCRRASRPSVVAQVSKVAIRKDLYRRFPIGRLLQARDRVKDRKACRLEARDTAGWKPALLPTKPLLTAALLLALCTSAFAHGDLHLQIVALTADIAKDPKNAELHLRRAELHRAHQDWDSAYADYERVNVLDPKMTVVDLGRGKMFLEANWPHAARITLDRFLARHTNSVEGFATRARALVKLNERVAAAKDYTAAINFSKEQRPELFLERAQALTAEGKEHFEEALAGLDEGIKKLGPLVTLQLYAIDVEIRQGRHDTALRRLEGVAAQSPRKETWLARKGEILQQAGRPEQARQAYTDALAAMNKLPPARRHVPAMVELEKRLLAAIESTKASPPAPAEK
jgi:predicted Zn-dependent protease